MEVETELTFSPRSDGITKVQNVANFRCGLEGNENLFGDGGGVVCFASERN